MFAEPPEPLVTCWRCDKLVPPRERCRYCRARLAGRGYEVGPAGRSPSRGLVSTIIIVCVAVVVALILGFVVVTHL